jgi:hypothetical protein
MSNRNACDMLHSLNCHAQAAEYSGSWTPVDAVRLLAIANEIKNNPERLTTPTVVEGNMTSFGRDSRYVNSKMDTVIKLLNDCIRTQQKVVFG